jgi:hypothetical protein
MQPMAKHSNQQVPYLLATLCPAHLDRLALCSCLYTLLLKIVRWAPLEQTAQSALRGAGVLVAPQTVALPQSSHVDPTGSLMKAQHPQKNVTVLLVSDCLLLL